MLKITKYTQNTLLKLQVNLFIQLNLKYIFKYVTFLSLILIHFKFMKYNINISFDLFLVKVVLV